MRAGRNCRIESGAGMIISGKLASLNLHSGSYSPHYCAADQHRLLESRPVAEQSLIKIDGVELNRCKRITVYNVRAVS